MNDTKAGTVKRSLIAGLVLAVLAALIIGLGELMGLDLQHVALIGAALGGVLGLVRHDPPWGKVAGFVVGFVVAWIGFALRAAMLPDTSAGRAWAALVVVGVLAVVCALTRGRLPLWSTLVGAAAMVGSYEEIYTATPSAFVAESPTSATTVLLAAAVGYLATALVNPDAEATPDARSRSVRGTTPPPDHGSDRTAEPQPTLEADLDSILTGDSK